MMKFESIQQARKETGFAYLGNINISSKLAKNGKISGQYTYGIYLSPASVSGKNVCSHSTPECRLGCLATSGRAGMELSAGKTRTLNSRIKKTRLFFEETAFFMQWVIAEIRYYQNKAKNDGFGFSVRLNCTSDIDWQHVYIDGKNIFQIFPNVNFYDYTKNPNKFINTPKNYHLTFSYTGRNLAKAEEILKMGYNIAVVFNVLKNHELPQTFNGYPVIDGDKTDYRINDEKGVVVGLRFKHIADKKAEKQVLNSCFVVQPNDLQCSAMPEYSGVENELELMLI